MITVSCKLRFRGVLEGMYAKRRSAGRAMSVLLVALCGLAISACDGILGSSIEDLNMVSEEDFRRVQGYKLHYDVYLPSTWAGWVHQEHCLFHYQPDTQSYLLENIRIGQPEVDDLGSRFKLSSADWRYQFGFGHHGVSLNESTFGLSPDTPAVLRLTYSTTGVSDMRIEWDQARYDELVGQVVSFEFKVLDDSSRPESMLLIKIKDPSEVGEQVAFPQQM